MEALLCMEMMEIEQPAQEVRAQKGPSKHGSSNRLDFAQMMMGLAAALHVPLPNQDQNGGEELGVAQILGMDVTNLTNTVETHTTREDMLNIGWDLPRGDDGKEGAVFQLPRTYVGFLKPPAEDSLVRPSQGEEVFSSLQHPNTTSNEIIGEVQISHEPIQVPVYQVASLTGADEKQLYNYVEGYAPGGQGDNAGELALEWNEIHLESPEEIVLEEVPLQAETGVRETPGVSGFSRAAPTNSAQNLEAETDNTGGMKESLDAKPADVSASTIRKDLRSAEPSEQLLAFAGEYEVSTPFPEKISLVQLENLANTLKEAADSELPSRIEIHLDPPSLGKLTVLISSKGEEIVVKLITSSYEAQQALLTSYDRLAEALAEKGLSLSGFFADYAMASGQNQQDRTLDAGAKTPSNKGKLRSTVPDIDEDHLGRGIVSGLNVFDYRV